MNTKDKSPEHHPSEALLLSYASGGLAEGFAVVVATHLEMCRECRSSVGLWEDLGGAMLECCMPASMPQSALDAALARIGSEPNAERLQPVRSPSVEMPAALAPYLPGGIANAPWRRVGRGVKQAILPTKGPATLRLISIPPGLRIPDHGHQGLELTLVLKGAFHDGAALFGPGDFEAADETLHHHPEAIEGEPCLCLAATDARLRFQGVVPRLAQRFLDI